MIEIYYYSWRNVTSISTITLHRVISGLHCLHFECKWVLFEIFGQPPLKHVVLPWELVVAEHYSCGSNIFHDNYDGEYIMLTWTSYAIIFERFLGSTLDDLECLSKPLEAMFNVFSTNSFSPLLNEKKVERSILVLIIIITQVNKTGSLPSLCGSLFFVKRSWEQSPRCPYIDWNSKSLHIQKT